MKKWNSIVLFLVLAVLGTACGRNVSLPESKETVTPVPVSMEKKQKASMEVHEQIQTLAQNEDTFFREDVRVVSDEDGVYNDGPYYSLMDLDQNGYLEMVVYNETEEPCPTFYEVTADGTLQKWTLKGDLPQEHECFSIFDTTRKADCYYDSQKDQYHYIVWDKLSLSQDDANVIYLDMVPDDTGATFRKIGGYTFDASEDGLYHYFDAEGKECEESDITAEYADMTKMTMYYDPRTRSKKEAGELYWWDMEHTIWENFLLREDYRCEKEKELTDDIRHQFFSLCQELDEDVMELTDGDGDDEIRYAAADLDHDDHVEMIVENITKGSYRIRSAECSEEEDCEKGKVWKTKGKSLTEITDQADQLTWYSWSYSKTAIGIGFNYDLWEDNLRESWLHF